MCVYIYIYIYIIHTIYWCFPGSTVVKNFPANAGDVGLIPGSGRSPGIGNGNPLQYSCLENPMDRGTWWATVHGVAKSQTRLSDYTHTHTHTHRYEWSYYRFLVWGLFSVDLFLSLYFLPREVPLAFVIKLVWWCWILLTFACLKSFWFLHQIWSKVLLNKVLLVVGSSLSSL